MSYAGRYKFRAYRKDRNHNLIKTALVAAQIDFIDTAAYGLPFDFLCIRDGRISLIEVKDPDQPPSKRELTEDEKELEKKLLRNKCRLYVVQTPEELLEIFFPQPHHEPERWRLWK